MTWIRADFWEEFSYKSTVQKMKCWADLETGIFISNYSAVVIDVPDSLDFQKTFQDETGCEASMYIPRPDSCMSVRKVKRAAPQRALLPSRLGRNLIVSRSKDCSTPLPPTRPESRAGSAHPFALEASSHETSWWNCSRVPTPRLHQERPHSQGAARRQHQVQVLGQLQLGQAVDRWGFARKGRGSPSPRCVSPRLLPLPRSCSRATDAVLCDEINQAAVEITVSVCPRMTRKMVARLDRIAAKNKGGDGSKVQQSISQKSYLQRVEVLPEVPKMLLQTIHRVVCGDGDDDGNEDRRLPAERQTTFSSDDLGNGGRELTGGEREKIAAVFREMAKSASGPSQPSVSLTGSSKTLINSSKETVEEARKAAEAKFSQLVISWSEVAKRLRGRLSSAHIQRLGIYFGMKGRVRMGYYMERVGHLVTASPEKRLRIAFGLLDVGGDSVIGRRDIFAALWSTRIDEHCWDTIQEAVFIEPGPTGIDFSDVSESSSFEVLSVVAASPADHQGVRQGSRLSHINGLDVEPLTPEEVRLLLTNENRPLQLTFRCRPPADPGSNGGMLDMSDFNQLLKALGSDNRVSRRIRVTVISAKNLRNSEAHLGTKSDPYCVVEIDKKTHVRFDTKVVRDCLDPVWNEERDIADFVPGEALKFTIKDKDMGNKNDEVLGRVTLPSSKFVDSGSYEGDLTLLETGVLKSILRVKVTVIGEGGINFADFAQVFAEREPSFLAPLTETLTGVVRSPTVDPSAKVPLKLRIIFGSATGLRPADMGGKSDPYCVCEVVGRPRSKVLSKHVTDTLDPVWNDRKELSDYYQGEALKFTVWDTDQGKPTANDELLGQVTLSSIHILPNGFDGELSLTDAGIGFSPKLRIKVSVAGTLTAAAKEVVQKDPILMAQQVSELESQQKIRERYETEIRELQLSMPHLTESDLTWHSQIFTALADEERVIRRGNFLSSAQKLLGVYSGRLAGRLYDILDYRKSGAISVLNWSFAVDRYRGDDWCADQNRVALAFSLYDFDGDGVISIQDAIALAQEVDRLHSMYGDQSLNNPICIEMRWLYGLVASTDSAGTLDLPVFKQALQRVGSATAEERSEPMIGKELVKHLNELAESGGRVFSDTCDKSQMSFTTP